MTQMIDNEMFSSCRSTLKETSFDSAKNEYMIESNDEVVDFDLVKRKYTNGLGLSEDCAKSVDALFEKNGRIVFAEFKNCDIKKKRGAIRDKIYNSILIYCDITGQTVKKLRDNSDFVLVYNGKDNSYGHPGEEHFGYISDKVFKYANKREILFGFDKLKGLYFNDVYTMNEREFKDYWNKDEN